MQSGSVAGRLEVGERGHGKGVVRGLVHHGVLYFHRRTVPGVRPVVGVARGTENSLKNCESNASVLEFPPSYHCLCSPSGGGRWGHGELTEKLGESVEPDLFMHSHCVQGDTLMGRSLLSIPQSIEWELDSGMCGHCYLTGK